MNDIKNNLNIIRSKIKQAARNYQRDSGLINLIAVSKGVSEPEIVEAIKEGCMIFGENRVKEAQEKWPSLLKEYPQVKLHFIGSLQSNKVKEAVELFDVIQSLDSPKLALLLAKEMERQNKRPQIFVQVNVGEEPQKGGVDPKEAGQFIKAAINDYKLPVTGVMAIAPQNEDPTLYFALLAKIARENGLPNISMGMSADYEIAIALGANFVRLGSAIFGILA